MTAFTGAAATGSVINPQVLNPVGQRRQGPSISGDVVLVSFWAALVPGLMWLGAMFGF
jgi:hypothetical protein